MEKGLCIKIGRNSIAHIWEDPWISSLPNFRPDVSTHSQQPVQLVRDLIDQDLGTWNYFLVHSLFTEEVARAILKINIPLSKEQDSLVWFPSKTGKFSIN